MRQPSKFWLVVAALLAIGSVAGEAATAAETDVPTLGNEVLGGNSFGNNMCFGESSPPYARGKCIFAPPGTFTISITVRCNTDRSGMLSYRVEGAAAGPYPGTFVENGVFTFGPYDPALPLPGNPPFFRSPVVDFQASFHIDSPAGEVEGTKSFDASSTGLGICTGADLAGGVSEGGVFALVEDAQYRAVIEPAAGGRFVDEGRTTVFAATGQTVIPGPGQTVETSGGFFLEAFGSDLTFARPLLPAAKEECKDGGFRVFGVFRNQGECVSFVATSGKNEPGRNSH